MMLRRRTKRRLFLVSLVLAVLSVLALASAGAVTGGLSVLRFWLFGAA